jgi:acyl-CoA reductase LuxC
VPARWAREQPPRWLDLADVAREQSFAALCMMSDAIDVIAAPPDGSYLVTIDALPRFEPSGGDRYLRVVPVAGPADLDRLIAPLPRQHLQCAAIAAGGAAARHHELRELLASWDVTRIVPPGIIGRPSTMWHHDGVACLGRMVTWCDHELVVPELLLDRDVGALIAEVEHDPSPTLGAALG